MVVQPQVGALVPDDVDARTCCTWVREHATLDVNGLRGLFARGTTTAQPSGSETGSSSGWHRWLRLIPESCTLIAVLLEERAPWVELTVVVVSLLLH